MTRVRRIAGAIIATALVAATTVLMSAASAFAGSNDPPVTISIYAQGMANTAVWVTDGDGGYALAPVDGNGWAQVTVLAGAVTIYSSVAPVSWQCQAVYQPNPVYGTNVCDTGRLPESVTSAAVSLDPAVGCTNQGFFDGTQYPPAQVAWVARNAGFTGDGLTMAVAIALAESDGYNHALHVDVDCSVDRGMWQISSVYQSWVSDQQAFDPNEAAQAAYTISNGGTDWSQWATYQNGGYQGHLDQARAAIAQLGG